MNCRSRRRALDRACRGFTLVELMVGLAIGLAIVAATALAVGEQLSDTRRLMRETQLQQELRAVADIVVRELRRSGHGAPAGGALAANPYTDIEATARGSVTFAYSTDDQHGVAENGQVDDREVAGFRLRAGVIQMQIGRGNWQPLTDPSTLTVTTFDVVPHAHSVSLAPLCGRSCPDDAPDCEPRLTVRRLAVLIEGHATVDPRTRRATQASVRPRADAVAGVCPT